MGRPGSLTQESQRDVTIYAAPGFEEKAREIFVKTGIPWKDQAGAASQDELRLILDERGLALTDGRLELLGDFSALGKRLHPANIAHELLVKAVKIRGMERPLRVVDAAAGLGEDSMILACAGFQVQLFERNPVIGALLADAIERALGDPDLALPASRMKLTIGDSIGHMAEFRPDVVYLDPMFPKRKKSGLVGKKFQLLQLLESPCSDEEDLLEAALLAKPARIVIKRPLKGPYLGQAKPSYSLKGKAVRYDCILLPVNVRP